MATKKVQEKQTPKIIEHERVYIYRNDIADGYMTNTFLDVVSVKVNPNGSHIVKTADGKEHFVGGDFIKVQAIPVKKDKKE